MSQPDRPFQYRMLFESEFSRLKQMNGHGVYSWAEGMTRKSARRIARNRARKAMKEMRAA